MTGRASGWKVVRARAAQRCHRCGGTIPKGARYESWTWFSDEPPLRCRSHLLCTQLDIGEDDDGMLNESYGEALWREHVVWHAPFWLDDPDSRWSAVAVWPVEVNEWLRSLPPIEWQL